MTKIRFNASASDSGAYELTINPASLELNQESLFSPFEVLDDAPVIQRAAFDGRMRSMRWEGARMDEPLMVAQLAVLRSYVGAIKYIRFSDAAYGNIAAATYYKHRIVAVNEKIRSGGGRLRWALIEMLFQPEP